MFAGEEFMQMGRMTPGPVLPQMTTFGEKAGGPSFTFGGHITARKYPKRYDKPPHTPKSSRKKGKGSGKGESSGGKGIRGGREEGKESGKDAGKDGKKRRGRRKQPLDRASRARAAAQRRTKRLADKDYSWLYEGEKPVKVSATAAW